MNILIVNGPNLNLLGKRDNTMYGVEDFQAIYEELQGKTTASLEYFQSNIEGELIDCLQSSKHDGIIMNAGGYTHTSVAIRDCIDAIDVPVVEVHISNVSARESFRHESFLSPVCVGCIFGFGKESYRLALNYFENRR